MEKFIARVVHMHHFSPSTDAHSFAEKVETFFGFGNAVCATPTQHKDFRYALPWRIGIIMAGPLVHYRGKPLAWGANTSWLSPRACVSLDLDTKTAAQIAEDSEYQDPFDHASLGGCRNWCGEWNYPCEVWVIPTYCKLLGLEIWEERNPEDFPQPEGRVEFLQIRREAALTAARTLGMRLHVRTHTYQQFYSYERDPVDYRSLS